MVDERQDISEWASFGLVIFNVFNVFNLRHQHPYVEVHQQQSIQNSVAMRVAI